MKIALQTDNPATTMYSSKFWSDLHDRYTNKLQQLREAMSDVAGAALGRRGAKRVTQARLVSDWGAKDASGSVARLADDVPIDSFKSDVRRKVALKKVMPGAHDSSEGEGILGDVLGKILDDDEKCFDDNGREIDCETGEPIEEVTRVVKRRATVAESAINVFREMYGGMAQTFGPPSEAPEALNGQDLGKYLDGKGKKLPPDDPKVDLRYSGSQPPVPGARCGSCVYFNPEMSSCRIVSNPITPALVCSMWTPSSEGEGAALQTFADEMQ